MASVLYRELLQGSELSWTSHQVAREEGLSHSASFAQGSPRYQVKGYQVGETVSRGMVPCVSSAFPYTFCCLVS